MAPDQQHSYWGSFASDLDLPNAAGSPNQSALLRAGHTAYVTGEMGIRVCVDATLGASQWASTAAPATTVSMRRSYGTGSLVFKGGAAPLTTFVAIANAQRGGGHWQLINEFDLTYNRCVAHVRAYDPLTNALQVEVEQRFATLADLVAWVNANVPQSAGAFTGDVQFELYDEIDGTVPMPAKVYGKNRLWAGVARTLGKYYHNPSAWSCADANLSSGRLNLGTVLNNIWSHLYPGSPLPAVASWTAAEFGCFWLSRNRRRRYDMPPFTAVGGGLTVPAPKPKRYARNIVAGTTALATASMTTDAGAADQVGYSALLPTGVADALPASFGPFQAFTLLGQKIMAGYTAVVGYPVTDGANGRAVLIKPVGMDQFYLGNFDDTKYRIEALGVQRRDFHPRLHVLGVTQAPTERSTSAIDGRDIATVFGYSNSEALGGIPGRHGYTTGSVRFQLRDLTTGHVGPLSTAAIRTVWRKRARPFALMVRNSAGV